MNYYLPQLVSHVATRFIMELTYNMLVEKLLFIYFITPIKSMA